MTILPKKKAEEESDSDDASGGCPHNSSPHGAAGHDPLNSPNSPEEVVGFHNADGFYHRRYDLSSSSGESSPELPSISKRASYRLSPVATASGLQGKKPLDSSPGYNSSEEYDGSRRPYVDPERERQFENVLRKERGFIIKKMRPDGACLFRAIADQIYGDQEMHGVVRNHCMDYMLKNAEFFSQYITDEDFEHYVDRKRQDQCYGNNIEMQAIAEMYNRPIELFQYSIEPINIFFGVYKTDNAPLRLSYHGSIHYNSVVDPCSATIGVGLGLAGHKPGLADKMQVWEAQRESENVHIEQTMLEDKKRSTDWEATYDAIEEAVTRESYLTWIRENEKREQPGGKLAGSQPSSSACRGNSPPSASTSQFSQVGGSLVSTLPPITSKKMGSTTVTVRSSSSPSSSSSIMHVKKLDTKKSRPSPLGHGVVGSPSKPSHHEGSRGGRGDGSRRSTPSPPSVGAQHQHYSHPHHHHSHHHRGSGSGTGTGPGLVTSGGISNVRSSPYYSPKDSRNGSTRGSSRHSPKDSTRGGGGGRGNGNLRGMGRHSPLGPDPTSSSPPPSCYAVPVSPSSPHLHFQSAPSSCENSPNRSPNSVRRPLLVNLNEKSSPSSPILLDSQLPLDARYGHMTELRNFTHISPPVPERMRTVNVNGMSLLVSSPSPPHLPFTEVPLSSGRGGVSRSPSPPQSGSQSPAHTLNFEDGRVLSHLPYEYSSFLDLPASALGLSEWEDDQILAAVLAASQQEYIDGLRSRIPDSEEHH